MIEASFDRMSRSAAVSGVYQYDTGQRLRLSGLPSPDELGEADDFLAGDLVAVQAHFGYEGDEQTQMRLAQWDDDRGCWMVGIPDEYLTRIEPVHVFVYVSHGSDEYGDTRARTMYEGVFTPISRPAPNDVVTEDQIGRWATLEAEVDLALAASVTATENAMDAAQETEAAAQEAEEAARMAQDEAKAALEAKDRLDAVDTRWGNMDASSGAGSEAGVSLDGTMLSFTLPTGATGAKGDTGDTGPAEFTMTFSDGVLTIKPN